MIRKLEPTRLSTRDSDDSSTTDISAILRLRRCRNHLMARRKPSGETVGAERQTVAPERPGCRTTRFFTMRFTCIGREGRLRFRGRSPVVGRLTRTDIVILIDDNRRNLSRVGVGRSMVIALTIKRCESSLRPSSATYCRKYRKSSVLSGEGQSLSCHTLTSH
jgi:hypothetical protein